MVDASKTRTVSPFTKDTTSVRHK